MLPVLTPSARPDEKRLRELFKSLQPTDQHALLRYAEYLVNSTEITVTDSLVLPEPETIARPRQESVVKAIKRLTATYPMLEKDKLLHQTSDLMASHVINGRKAPEVIDELEALFAEHYQQLKNEFAQNC